MIVISSFRLTMQESDPILMLVLKRSSKLMSEFIFTNVLVELCHGRDNNMLREEEEGKETRME